jgi:hypothetical protein
MVLALSEIAIAAFEVLLLSYIRVAAASQKAD